MLGSPNPSPNPNPNPKAATAGYTRVVGCMQWRCAATARLVGGLQRAMGAPLSANLYETPAGARGLEARY